MLRYNETTGDLEAYQSGSWRALRFKESTNITQQGLGTGDGLSTIYGPLSPTPPSLVESGGTWGGQNIMVYVENVYQLFTTNYTIVQNPTTTITSGILHTAGAITLSILPDVTNLRVGQTVSSPGYIANGTTITNVNYLNSQITISAGLTSNMPSTTSITCTYPTGYYVQFTGPSAYGKAVTVLHGFDR
jgi:hypothetical protein